MGAGLQIDKDYINAKVGSVALQLRDVLATAQNITARLAVYDGAALESLFGYTAPDRADLMDALYAMSVLVGLAHGNGTLGSPTDFRVGLSKVTGID